jgi:hypothetical protein
MPDRIRPSPSAIVRGAVIVGALLFAPWTAWGQEQIHNPSDDDTHAHTVESGYPNEVSGTSWLPIATPMYAWTANRGGWELMGHANVFAQFLFESGEIHRRGHQFGSINWTMGTAKRSLGHGRVTLQSRSGYPQPRIVHGSALSMAYKYIVWMLSVVNRVALTNFPGCNGGCGGVRPPVVVDGSVGALCCACR